MLPTGCQGYGVDKESWDLGQGRGVRAVPGRGQEARFKLKR
jgi:hypothetical protein